MKHEGLLRSIKTNDVYAYLGEEKFVNITRGTKGKLSKADAKLAFVAPITLNRFAQENPKILDLISRLALTIEPLTDEEGFERVNYFAENL